MFFVWKENIVKINNEIISVAGARTGKKNVLGSRWDLSYYVFSALCPIVDCQLAVARSLAHGAMHRWL
jgi:hypothetical protein